MIRQEPFAGANRGRQSTALMGPGHRNTNSRSSPARSIDPTSAPAVSLTETRFAAFEGSHESVEQRPLTLQQLHVGLGHGKPTDAVDFGILPDVARPFRPFESERVADGAFEIQV